MDKNNEYLHKIRHSSAHLLAMAVKSLYKNVKVAIGPVIDTGFYYDFDFGTTKITEEDLPKIEKQMQKMLDKGFTFEQSWVSTVEAKKIFADEPYKLQIVEEIHKGERDDFGKKGEVSLYKSEDFVDLCKGPHVNNSNEIKAFKLLNIAGAYWKGSEKNKMLTRIYGTAFGSKKELDDHLNMLEEAKKRDHRKLGKELDLFHFDEEIGQGLPIWLPKGNIIKEELENWAKDTEEKWGYKRVTTPIITKESLFYTSGHLPLYKESMYAPIVIENENYYIKPMNCPFHHKVYASRPRSYKELPLRIAEYGLCHRYEDSGSLFGLMRVRGMDMNDAHIYCTLEQATSEFVEVIKLHEYYYKILGIKEYEMELSLRNPEKMDKYHGSEKDWKLAEEMTIKAMEQSKVPFKIVNDGAAFYGPKMDFQIKSITGRMFTASTNQLDLYMPKQFKLKYIDAGGKEQTPVVIHRAPLGTHERFIGFLIEHFAGAFPAWLSPTQVSILNVSEKSLEYSQKIHNELLNDFRSELDASDETIGNKIRKATEQKTPFMLIVGEKEANANTVSVRSRDGKQYNGIKLSEFKESLLNLIKTKSLDLTIK